MKALDRVEWASVVKEAIATGRTKYASGHITRTVKRLWPTNVFLPKKKCKFKYNANNKPHDVLKYHYYLFDVVNLKKKDSLYLIQSEVTNICYEKKIAL